MLALLAVITCGLPGALPKPQIYTYAGTNNIDSAAPLKNSTLYVTYLGMFDSSRGCEEACISTSTDDRKCLSYTWQEAGSDDFAQTCYGRFNNVYWMPVPADGITSGMVLWGCTTPNDCSLNGHCSDGECICNPGFTGPRCGELRFKPTPPAAGYQLSEGGQHTSTWGGGIVHHNDTFYMIASEFVNHCGVYSWVMNSQVSIASTQDLTQPFVKQGLLEGVFAHEPNAIRTPSGEYVVWYAAYNRTQGPCGNCSDGATTGECDGPAAPMFYTEMRRAPTPLGPWSMPQRVLHTGPRDTDANFAAVVAKNGSLVGMSRIPNDGGSHMHLVTAPDYLNGTSYVEHPDHLFPEVPVWYVEDPSLWRDCQGYYHAVFHRLGPNGPSQGLHGVHAFSEDGLSWTFAGVLFNSTVEMEGGGTRHFHTRERPHVVLDPKDNCTVIAVTSGVILEPSGDRTYTLLQPVDL